METVAASEQDLIMLMRALVAPQSQDVWALMCTTRKLPPKIGPTCEELLGEALAHVWPALWRRSGARPGVTLRDGKVTRGRGWERHAPVDLEFSPTTLAFLRWIVASPLAAPVSTFDPITSTTLSVGDQVIIYLALSAAEGTPAQSRIAAQPAVRAAPLAWLGFPDVLTAGGEPACSFDSLATEPGSVVVEALSRELADRWHDVEISKRSITSPEILIALGTSQAVTLESFMDACDTYRRRDLAAWIIDALAPLIDRNLPPAPAHLDTGSPLSQRTSARHAAGALLRALTRWADWDRQHRGVRFIDDDYDLAQVLLSRFERIGTAGTDRVAYWLSDLASLAPNPTPSSDSMEAG